MRSKVNFIASYTSMPHYQVYYWLSLSKVGSLSLTNAPCWYRCFPKSDLPLDLQTYFESLKGSLGIRRKWDSPQNEQFAALYKSKINGAEISFAIDSHDSGKIVSPRLQSTCDFYFKANMWQKEQYPNNVLPIVNANGFLRDRHLAYLRRMRNQPKSIDFIFISRIWGGVEHNVKLFETLSRLDCSKKLLAIFVKGVTGLEETRNAIKRLESVGVECTFDLMPVKRLWNETSRAKVVMIRAGKHMCIPWRMIDLLCMGACIFADSEFEPNWPEPLVKNKHYITAEVDRPDNTLPSEEQEYQKINERIYSLIIDNQRRMYAEQMSAEYFDRYAAPYAVGKYILTKISRE